MKNYTASIFFLAAAITSLLAFGQQENRTRTRVVDYAEYDRLFTNLAYATNKTEAANQLMAFADKNFTAIDEEYFYVRYNASIYYFTAGEYLKVTEVLQQAIDAYEKNFPFYHRGYPSVNSLVIGSTYLQLSQVYQAQHLHAKNLRFLEKYRTLLENNPDPYIRRTFYAYLGESLLQTEQNEAAIQELLKLKELTESGAFTYNYRSGDEIYKITPEMPEEARQQILKARAEYDASMKKLGESQVVYQRLEYSNRLAKAYFTQYQFQECVPYARQTSDDMTWVFNDSHAIIEQSKANLNNSSSPDSVIQAVQQAAAPLKIIEQIGGTGLLVVISSIKSSQPALAHQYAKGFIEQGVYYQLTGDYNASENSYTKLFQAINTLKKIKWYAPTAENYEKVWSPYFLNLKVKSKQNEAALKIARDMIARQEQDLQRNFQYFTENEKREFFKNYTRELERYYSLLLTLSDAGSDFSGELMTKILQSKGLILDATREQERQLRKIKEPVTRAQIAEIKRLRDKLARFHQQASGSPAILDSVNRTSVRIADLERAVNLKLAAITVLKPVRWQDIQARLKPGDVYLEILRLQRDNFEYDKPQTQYWGLVIKPEDSKPTLFQISSSETFEGRSLRNYQNRVRGQLEDLESYNLYWKSIADHITNGSTLYLSSDGVYHTINPITLYNPTTQKYLLDETQIKRLATGRDLLLAGSPSAKAGSLVLVGNPRFEMSRKQSINSFAPQQVNPIESEETTRSGIAQLPGTQKEVDVIGVMASSDGFSTELLTDNRATEANVKALSNPSILHLATHGEFNQLSNVDIYLKSKLILAGAADQEPLLIVDNTKYEDGFLTAYEVTQLNLEQTQLVVLSACETGLGEIQSGEGVWGLQRAFQLAGAKTVMGSLWKISDEATVTFMEAFYKEYLGKKDVYQAYQVAMVATRTHYPHPYYWGAFTLVGAN